MMPLIVKRFIAILLVTTLCSSTVCYGMDVSPMTALAVPSRVTSPEFQHIVELEIGVRQAIKDLHTIDAASLFHLGSRRLERRSIFRPVIDGIIRFQEVEEVDIIGTTYYVVRADVKGSDYACLVDKSGCVSIAPYEVYVRAKDSEGIKVVRDFLDPHAREVLNDYIEHEISTANNEAIDPWISRKMTDGFYAVDETSGNIAIYQHPGRQTYSRRNYESLISEIGFFLRAAGVKDHPAILEELLSLRPLVIIPYKEDEMLPSVTINGTRVPVTAHSSKFATYIFLPEIYYNAAISGEEWYSDLKEHIKEELIHEIGAVCGLKVALMNGAISNALDMAYGEYLKAGQPSELNVSPVEVEILTSMAPVDLLNLELRNDYAAGKVLDKIYKKGIFARIAGLAVAAIGLGCQPSVLGANNAAITTTVPSPAVTSPVAIINNTPLVEDPYLTAIYNMPGFKDIVNNKELFAILTDQSKNGGVNDDRGIVIGNYLRKHLVRDTRKYRPFAVYPTIFDSDMEALVRVIADMDKHPVGALNTDRLDLYFANMKAIYSTMGFKAVVTNGDLLARLQAHGWEGFIRYVAMNAVPHPEDGRLMLYLERSTPKASQQFVYVDALLNAIAELAYREDDKLVISGYHDRMSLVFGMPVFQMITRSPYYQRLAFLLSRGVGAEIGFIEHLILNSSLRSERVIYEVPGQEHISVDVEDLLASLLFDPRNKFFPRKEELTRRRDIIANMPDFKRITNNTDAITALNKLAHIRFQDMEGGFDYYLALYSDDTITGRPEYTFDIMGDGRIRRIDLATLLKIIADAVSSGPGDIAKDKKSSSSPQGALLLGLSFATGRKKPLPYDKFEKIPVDTAKEKAALGELGRVVSEIPSLSYANDRADAINNILWSAGTESITIDEAKDALNALAPEIAKSAEERNKIYEMWITLAKEILVSMALSVPGRFKSPDNQTVKEIAVSLLNKPMEIFIPASQMPKDTAGKFRSVVQRIFGDRLRIYNSVDDLKGMIKDPSTAVVMAVDLVESDIGKLKDIDGSVRFINFSGASVDAMTPEEHENYIAETISILMIARSITEVEAKDDTSSNYRLLAHLLESHVDANAIDSYILNIVDSSIDSIVRRRNIIINILKAVPIMAYKVMKPVIEVLWSA